MSRLACILAIAALLSSCYGQGENPKSHNDSIAAKHAYDDAMRAIAAPEGSMQRESAILHIRATQEAILQAGDTAAAALYADSAASILRKANLIY